MPNVTATRLLRVLMGGLLVSVLATLVLVPAAPRSVGLAAAFCTFALMFALAIATVRQTSIDAREARAKK